jgi:hypothetical protein
MMKKRILSIALVLILCLAIAPAVFAAEETASVILPDEVQIQMPETDLTLTLDNAYDAYLLEDDYYGSPRYHFFLDENGGSVVCNKELDSGFGKWIIYLFEPGHKFELRPERTDDTDYELDICYYTVDGVADAAVPEENDYDKADRHFVVIHLGSPSAYDPLKPLLPLSELAAGLGPDSKPPASSPVTAKPTSSTVLVNGQNLSFDAYNIGGNNYFKLRDLAYTLNGTEKQFEVGWDGAANAISLTSGQPYTAVGGEMAGKGSEDRQAVPTSSKITIDGAEVSLIAYNIDDNNYFKLRDIGQAFDFGVDWDSAKNTIVIDTSKGSTVD